MEAVLRYTNWQLSSRIYKPEQIKPWVEKLSLIVKRGYHSSTSCHYFFLPELNSMGFLLHYLRPNEIFFDVGANIGAYSLLASGVVGAKSVAFEPSPSSYGLMLKNIELNQLSNLVQVHPIGLGAAKQQLDFTINDGIQNHIAVKTDQQTRQIQLAPMDDFGEEGLPVLIKMDVEGYETAVVAGANETLSSPVVNALIVEEMGLGERYGFDEKKLHKTLLGFGFELADYQALERKLERISTPLFGNNLYIRDFTAVDQRVKTAPQLSIHGISF